MHCAVFLFLDSRLNSAALKVTLLYAIWKCHHTSDCVDKILLFDRPLGEWVHGLGNFTQCADDPCDGNTVYVRGEFCCSKIYRTLAFMCTKKEVVSLVGLKITITQRQFGTFRRIGNPALSSAIGLLRVAAAISPTKLTGCEFGNKRRHLQGDILEMCNDKCPRAD